MGAELEGQEIYRQTEAPPKLEYLTWDLILYLRREPIHPGQISDDDRISLHVVFNDVNPDYNAVDSGNLVLPLTVGQFQLATNQCLELWQAYVTGAGTQAVNLISGGQQFFQRLFGNPAVSDEDLYFFREYLRVETRPRRIRIMAPPDLQFPWNLLYVSNQSAVGNRPVEGFLGARYTLVQHLQVPRMSERRRAALRAFASREQVHISLHRDTSDARLGRSLEDLLVPLENEKVVQISRRDAIDPLLADLQRNTCVEDFMYFCCHGGQAGARETQQAEEATCFLFAGRGLYPVQFSAALGDGILACQPLVFINSCNGGRLGRTYFESFVPVFLVSGASTVVGPTVGVDKGKALDFAERVMEEMLLGENVSAPNQEIVADVIQRVRRNMLSETDPDLTPLLFQTMMRTPVHFSRRFKKSPAKTSVLASGRVANV